MRSFPGTGGTSEDLFSNLAGASGPDASGRVVFQRLIKQWRELASDRAGHRFQNYYRREQRARQKAHRVWKLGAGVALVIVGVALLFVPGPGSVLIVIGGAFLAGESQRVARWLDAGELKARKVLSRLWKAWHRSSSFAKFSLATGLAVGLGLIIGWLYSYLT